MLVAATLLVAAGLALQFTRNQVTSQVDSHLNGLARSFQDNVPGQVGNLVGQGLDINTALVTATTTWLSFASAGDGEGAFAYIPHAPSSQQFIQLVSSFPLADQFRHSLAALVGSSTSKWLNLKTDRGERVRVLRVPINDPHGNLAELLFVGANESKLVNHSVLTLLKDIALASAIGLVFATLLGLVAVRRTLRPLAEMSREVETIQESDDLSKRLSGRGPRDEVGRLAEGFDRMLGRLQEAFLSQRRFLSDASHELRTPMTVVRGQLELLAMDVESLPGRRSMSIAIEELDRMGRMVEDLLLLARLDEGMQLAQEPVEVELVVGEAILRGMSTGGDVRAEVEPELYVLGDADRLLQVLTNLVTNAVKHGRGAPVSVSAWNEGGVARIEVADQGPGISPQDLPHVFERLYRGAKARSENPSGAGLGLAIAASLMKAMDGRLDVASTVGVGTAFTVSLPVVQQDVGYGPPARQPSAAEA